jgi:hypothetical protein
LDKGVFSSAIGQNSGEVAGVKIQTKVIPLKNIDTTYSLSKPRAPDYYNYIIEAKPKRVVLIQNPENPEFYQLLELNILSQKWLRTLVLLSTNQY